MSNILDANSYIDYFSEPKEEFRMTPNARFTEFLTDIEPSSTTKTNASSAHIKLRATLRADETFGPMHRHTFLSGSYKRDTAIRPHIKDGNAQRPDADIIVVTKHELYDDPVDVVDAIHAALNRHYTPTNRQAPQGPPRANPWAGSRACR
jgi:hypothetical protein